MHLHGAQYLNAGDTTVRVRQRRLIGIIGQSNAQGDGLVSEMSSSNSATYSGSYSAVPYAAKMDGNTDPPGWTEYTKQSLSPLVFSAANKHGIELSMMRDLDAGVANHWACAKFTGSGTNLFTQWNVSGTYPSLDGTGKNYFTQCVEWFKAKETELSASLEVLCWIQGEGDGGNSAAAAAYQANLTALISAFRTFWPQVGFVYGRLNSDYVNAAGSAGLYTSTIQAAQDAIASTPRVYEINPDSYALRADHTHYPADSLILMGHAYAGKVANCAGVDLPPLASFTSSSTGLNATFTDTTVAPGSTVASWAWNFGDTGTSTLQNPTHSYSTSGSYTVQLTVTAANGKTNTYSTSVTISNVAWTVDPTANLAFPANATEHTAFLSANSATLSAWSNPDSINGFQDSTTPIADSVGTITLPLIGAGATYQVAVSGFTRKAATLTDGTSGGFKTTSTSLPDISLTSCLLLAWIYFPSTAPAANRFAMILGTNTSIQWTTAKKIIGSSGSNSTTGTVVYSGVVEPCMIKVNHTGAVTAIYTSQEKIIPTNGAVTGKQVNLGSNGAAASTGYLYSARWSSAAAERSDADVKAYLQALGKTVPWT